MQREAADYFGWDETYVSQLVNGRRSPGLENAIHIERHTGIAVEAWMSNDVDTPEQPDPVTAGKANKTKA